MSCCGGGFTRTGSGSQQLVAQAGITVSRTTIFALDGTEQFPTFDTVIKSDPTGKFLFTPGTSQINLTESTSYRVSAYLTIRNESEIEFKCTLFNNGVEIPDIATFTEEGTDQPGVDEYQVCLSLEAIDLAAGTLQLMVQEVTRSGTGTNQLEINTVLSVSQNSGVSGAAGSSSPNTFSTDEFLIYASATTGDLNPTTALNAFIGSGGGSNISVLIDKASIVDTALSKIIPTEGTWELNFFVKHSSITSNAFIQARIVENPGAGNTNIAEGPQIESGGSNAINGSTVSLIIKTDGTREFGFFTFSNDNLNQILGGATPLRTYAYGKRINTDDS